MNCEHCDKPIPAGSRRDRRYCTKSCSALASIARRKAGLPPPPRWQHPALESGNPALLAAATHARQLGEAHGWSRSTTRGVMDGLTAVLEGRPAGEHVMLAEIRSRTPRRASTPRVAEVLADLELLDDDTVPAVRSWVERRTRELPSGFAPIVRAWLLLLLNGDTRHRPRSPGSIYVYFGAVRPFIQQWAAAHEHLREITATDVSTALEPLRGWRRRNALDALRSLFRFAKKRGLIFTDPTTRLKAEAADPSLVPMTDAEIRAVQGAAVNPAQRLIVSLAAVHTARPAAIRHLKLDDLDLPNRRITIAGHAQRLSELAYRALRSWLELRRATWPHTPNPHVLVSERTALGTQPIGKGYLQFHPQRHGIDLDRIRRDRILHEALTAGPDPLHLSLVFNLSHTAASRYAAIAQHLLDYELEQPEQALFSRT